MSVDSALEHTFENHRVRQAGMTMFHHAVYPMRIKPWQRGCILHLALLQLCWKLPSAWMKTRRNIGIKARGWCQSGSPAALQRFPVLWVADAVQLRTPGDSGPICCDVLQLAVGGGCAERSNEVAGKLGYRGVVGSAFAAQDVAHPWDTNKII